MRTAFFTALFTALELASQSRASHLAATQEHLSQLGAQRVEITMEDYYDTTSGPEAQARHDTRTINEALTTAGAEGLDYLIGWDEATPDMFEYKCAQVYQQAVELDLLI